MIKTGRRYGASCFSIFSADLSGARPRRSDRRYRAFAPWAPLLSVSIPSILCTRVRENVSRHFCSLSWTKALSGCPVFGHFFLSRCRPVSVCFCPISPDRRKNRQNKIFHRGRGCFFHFHDTITVQILMEVLPMAYQIGSGCVSCGACADVCPVGAISQGDDHYVIDANSCLDCGTCSDTCPNGAISPAE